MNGLIATKEPASMAGNNRAIAIYSERCGVILARVFKRNATVQSAFSAWLSDEFRDTRNAAVLLHDAPLLTVARYLGIPGSKIDHDIIAKAAKVARKEKW